MSDPVLLTRVEDHAAFWTLNRPSVMNAFNFELLHALRAAADEVRFDPAVRVVIVTGAGERAFCAGADLKERATLPPLRVREFIFTIRNLFTSIEELN